VPVSARYSSFRLFSSATFAIISSLPAFRAFKSLISFPLDSMPATISDAFAERAADDGTAGGVVDTAFGGVGVFSCFFFLSFELPCWLGDTNRVPVSARYSSFRLFSSATFAIISSLPAFRAFKSLISFPLDSMPATISDAFAERPAVGAEDVGGADVDSGFFAFGALGVLPFACWSCFDFFFAVPFSPLPISFAPRINGKKSVPPMKGLRTSGTTTPSGVWWFSSKQQIPRPVATSVAFSMCT